MSYNQELLFADNVSTTLGSALSSGATTMTVASGTGADFPAIADANHAFLATLYQQNSSTGVPNEIVLVTGITGDVLTITRGQEGTAPAAWSVGDIVAMQPTAGTMKQLAQLPDLQQQTGNSADDSSGSANAGVITLAPVPWNLGVLIGAPIRVLKNALANTGAYTLDVNGLGAIAVKLGGAALQGSELAASSWFTVQYDGLVFELVSGPPYHAVNRAGDTMTGKLTLPASSGGGPAGLNLAQGGEPASPVSGDVIMSAADILWFLSGQWYQAVHTEGLQNQTWTYGLDGTLAPNSINVIINPSVPGSYTAAVDGQRLCIKINLSITGACTLSVNSESTYPVKKRSAGSLVDTASGDLAAGHIYDFVFDATDSVWQLMTPTG